MPTLADIRTDVAGRAKIIETDTDEKALLDGWINRAQEDIQNAHSWWFLEYEFALAMVADQRFYAFPSTDIAGATADLESINIKSMQTAKDSLSFFWPSQQDRAQPGWLNTALSGSTGSPETWSVVRERIVFDVAPTSDWVSENSTVWFRGWINLPTLSADGDTSLIPSRWHWAINEGAFWRSLQYQDPTGQAWIHAKAAFDGPQRRPKSVLETMIDRCRPVRGRLRKTPAPLVFHITGRRSVNVRN